jgi:hypothetical protein
VRLQADAAGAYVLKVTWSPFWSLRAGAGELARAAGDWLLLRAERPGVFQLQFSVDGAGLGRAL